MTEPEPRQLFLYEHDATRVELLVRILYWIAIGIIAWVYGILALIALIVQWFHILILGRRNKSLSDFAKGYLEYTVHRLPYVYLMTDRRPAIMPDPVKIFEQGQQKEN